MRGIGSEWFYEYCRRCKRYVHIEGCQCPNDYEPPEVSDVDPPAGAQGKEGERNG